MRENSLKLLDAYSDYLVNAWSARGHRFESYSSRHNGKIAQLVEHVHNENASSFISRVGEVSISSVSLSEEQWGRATTRNHIAEWTSQFKSSGPLPEERRSVADLCSQGLFAPSKYANRARGWIVCSFRKLPPACSQHKIGWVKYHWCDSKICGLSFESAI